ncbi:MAG TPA: glycosyltransferase family 4 protein [Blastocatellia bacterium]|nr:glycosyltransferase family 4 protein [Blastocatellia bacterium]
MNPDPPEIGYILKGYQRTSETFITNEISLLEGAGLALSIFSLKKLAGQQRHGAAARISVPVTWLPETTPSGESNLAVWLWRNLPGFAPSHRRLFRLRPVVWTRALLEVLLMCLKYRAGTFAPPNRAFIKEFLQAGFIAREVIESGRIRHLHAHFCHTTTTVTMLASRLCGVPYSFTAHAKDIYREDMNPGDLLSVKMRRARFVVTCTRTNQEYLERLNASGAPIYTIYHGLDLQLFSAATEREGRKEQSDAPLILSVGRLVEKKGFTFLVEACRLLKDKGYQFHCRIVGGADAYAEKISGLIEHLQLGDTVSLHPAVTQEELRRIYEQATVFVLPCQVLDNGDRDGIPNVLVEAMAMELPVVSTDISGIPELITHHQNGLLVPQKNAPALAAAMEELLINPDLRRELGSAARVTVTGHFDAKQNILRLKQLFESCLKSDAVPASGGMRADEIRSHSGVSH